MIRFDVEITGKPTDECRLELGEIINWCKDTFGNCNLYSYRNKEVRWYYIKNHSYAGKASAYFRFRHEDDALAFKLKWL